MKIISLQYSRSRWVVRYHQLCSCAGSPAPVGSAGELVARTAWRGTAGASTRQTPTSYHDGLMSDQHLISPVNPIFGILIQNTESRIAGPLCRESAISADSPHKWPAMWIGIPRNIFLMKLQAMPAEQRRDSRKHATRLFSVFGPGKI